MIWNMIFIWPRHSWKIFFHMIYTSSHLGVFSCKSRNTLSSWVSNREKRSMLNDCYPISPWENWTIGSNKLTKHQSRYLMMKLSLLMVSMVSGTILVILGVFKSNEEFFLFLVLKRLIFSWWWKLAPGGPISGPQWVEMVKMKVWALQHFYPG